MRALATLAALLAATAPLAAQGHPHHGRDGRHGAPAGWQFRLDRANADRSAVHFVLMGDGMHFTLGPAAIFYNPRNTRSGAYQLSAQFTQMRPPQHPEAYGLMLAGRNLEAAHQDYMYFLVRGDGRFSVKHRAGDEVHTIVDWTQNAAVRRADAQGRATNALTVDVGPQAIRFLVNGTQVHRIDRAAAGHVINTDGVYGVRINHNLDVHVSGLRTTGG